MTENGRMCCDREATPGKRDGPQEESLLKAVPHRCVLKKQLLAVARVPAEEFGGEKPRGTPV